MIKGYEIATGQYVTFTPEELKALEERAPGSIDITEFVNANLVDRLHVEKSYFLGRETLIPTRHPGMAIWREHLFSWMMRNSSSAVVFFNLPANQVIELGAQVEL